MVQTTSVRRRIVLSCALAAVIAVGLASRSFDSFPAWFSEHAGDALWTVAAYLTLAILFPKASPLRLGLCAFGVSLAVELSQLIQTPWLNAVRKTLPGRLLLGSTFVWADLLRYLVGAVAATLADEFAQRLAIRNIDESPAR